MCVCVSVVSVVSVCVLLTPNSKAVARNSRASKTSVLTFDPSSLVQTGTQDEMS